MTPEYLRSSFVFRNNLNYLRNTENTLTFLQPRTDYLKKSFLYSGAQLWNGLPIELRQATSLNDFNAKQDACYTGITRDAGADSFIPTVCFAD